MEQQRLYIITELFYPDETATSFILTNIANKLSEKYDVHVICGPISSKTPTNGRLCEAISIHRSNWFNLNKDNVWYRTLRFVCISIILSAKLLLWARRGDKVFLTTNPAPLVLFVAFLKRMKRFSLTLLVHDVFPENVIPAGIFKNGHSLPFRILCRLFDCAYARADHIITIGRDMKEVVQRKIAGSRSKAKLSVITNWADTNLIKPSPMPDSERLTIQYSGNLGRVQGLLEFIHLFCDVHNQSLFLSMWGGGAMESDIRKIISKRPEAQISLMGAFSREQQDSVLSQADLCLITLADGMYGLGVPSKSYNIMAAGRPILYIGPKDSEIWRVVSNHHIGYCFEPSDKIGISTFLKNLNIKVRQEWRVLGDKAHRVAVERYSKDIVLAAFDEIV